jgi:hypothetical protein
MTPLHCVQCQCLVFSLHSPDTLHKLLTATISSHVQLTGGLSLIGMNTEQKGFFGDRTPSHIHIMILYTRTVSLVEGGRDDLCSAPLGANSLVH